MTLATRCPTCGTVFRVVQDQLRVSQGWVRCGRCSQAFNALESMVEVPTVLAPAPAARTPESDPFPATDFGPTAVMEWPDSPPTSAPPSPPSPTPAPMPGRSKPAAAPASAALDDDSAYVLDDPPTTAGQSGSLLDLPLGMHLIASDGAVAAAVMQHDVSQKTEPFYGVADDPAVPVDVLNPESSADDGRAEPFMVLAQSSSQVSAQANATAAAQATSASTKPDLDASLTASLNEVPDRAPSFVIKAERAARWRRPGVRVALALLALVGFCGLGAQVAHAFRDRIVAAMPTLRPAMQQACSVLGCTIAEFRQIESLSVESSGLTRMEGAPVYRLTVTLRNRAALEVAAPALDVSLTDAQGKPIARRVLQMSDLYLPLRTLKAGTELPIQVSLSIGDRPVTGYTVEIFYP